jgi:hypothetical protein
VKEYKDGEIVLARHILAAEAWSAPLKFFSNDEDFIQVGAWCYDEGKHLLAHAHNEVPRTFPWTQEALFVWKGAIRAHVYNTKREKVDEFVAQEGDVVIMLAGGHGYDVLEDGTRVLEVKNGPYLGADADRVRLNTIAGA